jgi:hypothetical protein
MSSSRRGTVLVCLTFLGLGCSTEEVGLHGAGVDAQVAQQSVEQDTAVAIRPDRAPDRPVPTPDAGAGVDVPAAAPDAAPDVALPPDTTPDLPPPTNQPLGTACTKGSECKSGHCFDGVCCNDACTDGCSACTKARTGKADGTCATAADLEGKACGRACGTVMAVPSVIEKICQAGACVLPLAPRLVERCRDDDPCRVAFCDDNAARCVTTGCPQSASCCCRSANGQRTCTREDQCRGERMCVP